jgi:hypothetical protein
VEASSQDRVTAPDRPDPAIAVPEPATRRWWQERLRVPAGLWSFLVIAAVLLARNAYLFSTKIYENQDYAANTIAVLQAKHFQLLLGNYSKENFYHPGPAFLYVMAAGESLFHDALHLVPTPWNGQVLAILLLNAALLAAAVAVIARHAKSTQVTLACAALVLLFVALHPLTVNSPWFPYLYFAPALLMLVSAASVATGETFALPVLALSAWLCIHGQAEFLVFAPLIVIVALAGHFWTRRKNQTRLLGPAWHWIGAAVISALFALPIVIYTAQHFPGQFGLYMGYREHVAKSGQIHHSLITSVSYTMRFWWPGRPSTVYAPLPGAVIAVALTAVAVLLAVRCPLPGLRRFLLWSLVMAGVLTVIFVYYAQTAISDNNLRSQSYLGYFTWAAPLIVVLVVTAGAVVHLRNGRTIVLPLIAAVAAGAVVATVVPQTQDDRFDPPAKYLGVPKLPQLVQTMSTAAHGRPIVVRINETAWFDAVGVVAYGDRIGRRACVTGPHRWTILFRSQSVCTRAELRSGVTFWFYNSGAQVPRGQALISRLPDSLVTEQLPTLK